MHHRSVKTLMLALGALALASCGSDDLDSDEEAREAYLGLDGAIGKAINLGFDGFNAATSANIPDQTTDGDVSGTLVVSGQVDAGVSPNKEMRLNLALTDYRDDVPDSDIAITYDTDDAALPALTMSLRDIPNGTLTGTLVGDIAMRGDIEGSVHLELTIDGTIEPGPGGGVVRAAGTRITGTATSGEGTYTVDVTL